METFFHDFDMTIWHGNSYTGGIYGHKIDRSEKYFFCVQCQILALNPPPESSPFPQHFSFFSGMSRPFSPGRSHPPYLSLAWSWLLFFPFSLFGVGETTWGGRGKAMFFWAGEEVMGFSPSLAPFGLLWLIARRRRRKKLTRPLLLGCFFLMMCFLLFRGRRAYFVALGGRGSYEIQKERFFGGEPSLVYLRNAGLRTAKVVLVLVVGGLSVCQSLLGVRSSHFPPSKTYFKRPCLFRRSLNEVVLVFFFFEAAAASFLFPYIRSEASSPLRNPPLGPKRER